MTRSEQLHCQIAAMFRGESVGDCLDALCRQFAACLIFSTEDMEQTENAVVEMSERTWNYVQAYRARHGAQAPGGTVQ